MTEKKLFLLGKTLAGRHVYLTDKDLAKSVHIVGLSQSGKSRLVEQICRELIKAGKGFFFLDPHRTTFERLIRWQASTRYPRTIRIFDPSYPEKVIGFNPFIAKSADVERIQTQAQRMADATLKVWGANHPAYYGNIQRWLRALYYVLLQQKLSISQIDCFLYYKMKDEREAFIRKIDYPRVKNDLIDFYAKSKHEFDADIRTTRNRLQEFTHKHVQRIIGLHSNNINLQSVLDSQGILLGNFQPSGDSLIGHDNLRVIGTLMINEIWETIRRRPQASNTMSS